MSRRMVERRHLSVQQLGQSVTLDYGHLSERRAEGEELPKIVGYTAVFGVDAEITTFFGSFKERIRKGAFRRAIREGQDVRALRNHEPDNLLGRTTAKTLRLKEDDIGLWIEIDTPDTTVGRDTVESIRRGDLSGMSFAFIVKREKWISGEDGQSDLRIIEDVELYDVGPVTYPAYSQTTADIRANSRIHQMGIAELGRSVPPLPDENAPVKVLEFGRSSDEKENNMEPSTDAPVTDFIAASTIPSRDSVESYRRRLAHVQSMALRNNVLIKLLTK